MRRPARDLAAAVALLALGSGCALVQPWDKRVLAQPCMQFGDEAPAQAFTAHALITNEEAVGGEGGSGGGCGCR